MMAHHYFAGRCKGCLHASARSVRCVHGSLLFHKRVGARGWCQLRWFCLHARIERNGWLEILLRPNGLLQEHSTSLAQPAGTWTVVNIAIGCMYACMQALSWYYNLSLYIYNGIVAKMKNNYILYIIQADLQVKRRIHLGSSKRSRIWNNGTPEDTTPSSW